MEFGKELILIDNGSHPVWHPDGNTIIYSGRDGFYKSREVSATVSEKFIGGNFSATTYLLQPNIFITEVHSK